jgi:hypothetical protein
MSNTDFQDKLHIAKEAFKLRITTLTRDHIQIQLEANTIQIQQLNPKDKLLATPIALQQLTNKLPRADKTKLRTWVNTAAEITGTLRPHPVSTSPQPPTTSRTTKRPHPPSPPPITLSNFFNPLLLLESDQPPTITHNTNLPNQTTLTQPSASHIALPPRTNPRRTSTITRITHTTTTSTNLDSTNYEIVSPHEEQPPIITTIAETSSSDSEPQRMTTIPETSSSDDDDIQLATIAALLEALPTTSILPPRHTLTSQNLQPTTSTTPPPLNITTNQDTSTEHHHLNPEDQQLNLEGAISFLDSSNDDPSPSSTPPHRAPSPTFTYQYTTHRNITIHDNTHNKGTWALNMKTDAKILVLGDSNLRKINNIPDHWEVHVYPGVRLGHLAKLIDKGHIRSSVTDVVIQVGINHRDCNFRSTTSPELDQLRGTLHKHRIRAHYVEISFNELVLPAYQVKNIQRLNETALRLFGIHRYIKALSPNQILIEPGDPYRTHHTRTTVDYIRDTIQAHLLLN